MIIVNVTKRNCQSWGESLVHFSRPIKYNLMDMNTVFSSMVAGVANGDVELKVGK